MLADHAGSWIASVDRAIPGIVMFGNPAEHVGETYAQEHLKGEAEDMATLMSARKTVSIPFGTFNNVLQSYEFTSLDADSKEHKFYAKGIGIIKTVNLTTGEEFLLLETGTV